MDPAHDWTDGQIEALAKRFEGVYGEAARDMRESLETHLASFERENAKWSKLVESGAQTQENYDAWKRAQATRTDYLHGMVDRLATDATRANQKALDMVNDRIPRVYAENANYGAYQVESGLGFDTHSFDLYDESTVRRLMATTEHDQIIHEVIPVGPARPDLQSLRVDLDAAKDVRWNRQKFTAAITQSILQGESVPNAAKRLMGVLNMDRAMATRAARTAMTGAENAGRVDSYKRAKAMGIELEQEWMATVDGRTRYSHRQLDGQHVPVGKKFEVEGHEIEFPGDPKAHPSETYNCRCTLVAWLPGIEKEDPERWSRLPKDMTYEDWKNAKKQEEREYSKIPDIATWGSISNFDAVNASYLRQLSEDIEELSALPKSEFVKTNETIAFTKAETPLRFMLRDYWGSMKYEAVNGRMRGHVSDEVGAWIEKLQKNLKENAGYSLDEGIELGKRAIEKTTLEEPIVVHRYIRDGNKSIDEALSGVGNEFVDKAFVSTTTVDQGDGVAFSGSKPAYITHIYVPEGKGRGIPAQTVIDEVTDCSNYAGKFAAREDEFTLAPSTKFRVVERKDNEVWLTVVD